MLHSVCKRDGSLVPFNANNIEKAVLASFEAVDETITDYARDKAQNIAKYVEDCLEDRVYTVEEIQDLVEKGLMSTKRKDVAKAYILYRQERTKEREKRSQWYKDFKAKAAATNVENQNANVDEYSFGGRKGEADRIMMKKIALEDCVSPKAARNHIENRVYIHDLDSYLVGMHNCMSIPFDDLLANGFTTRSQDVRPAGSINTAFQLVAVIFQLQSLCQFGGCSATHLDWTMVPYVQKSFAKHFKKGLKYVEGLSDKNIEDIYGDAGLYTIEMGNDLLDMVFHKAYHYALDMTEQETSQAVEGMFHNLNTLQSRSGDQLPFTSINLGTCTLPEGRMVTKAVLEEGYKGGGKLHQTYIFPCVIFQVMNGVNKHPEDPNYDLFRLSLRNTAKRLYPNYANVDWSGNKGYDINDPTTYFSTMGCRTANGWDINGLGQKKDGRGNICPVTVVLPTIAMEAKIESDDTGENILQVFFRRLEIVIEDAKDALLERFNWIASQSATSAKFMYENNVMAGYIPEDGIRSALRHGTLALGQLGLAECLQILIKEDHTSDIGMTIAKEIEKRFQEDVKEYKEKYHLNFGVYYTPAENLAYTALKNFRQKYGVIPNVSDKEFFTNSMHVPVWHECSPFEKIDIESELTGYSSAGCITYVELEGSVLHNIDALEQIVLYAMDKDIPYFAINVPSDTCLDCGYQGLIDDNCPNCHGNRIQRLRRVTG